MRMLGFCSEVDHELMSLAVKPIECKTCLVATQSAPQTSRGQVCEHRLEVALVSAVCALSNFSPRRLTIASHLIRPIEEIEQASN